jgi:hypothetical protein
MLNYQRVASRCIKSTMDSTDSKFQGQCSQPAQEIPSGSGANLPQALRFSATWCHMRKTRCADVSKTRLTGKQILRRHIDPYWYFIVYLGSVSV